MNKIATSIALLTCFFSNSLSQTLLEDNFDYPSANSLTNHGWSIVQGGIDVTTVAASGLSYTGYLSSGIGNAALLDQNSGGDHEDLGKSFTSQTAGNVYVSFLINASAVDMTASFNSPLYVSASAGTGSWGRVYIDMDNDSNIRFGLSQFTESPIYTGFTYALNTTYLIVLTQVYHFCCKSRFKQLFFNIHMS